MAYNSINYENINFISLSADTNLRKLLIFYIGNLTNNMFMHIIQDFSFSFVIYVQCGNKYKMSFGRRDFLCMNLPSLFKRFQTRPFRIKNYNHSYIKLKYSDCTVRVISVSLSTVYLCDRGRLMHGLARQPIRGSVCPL